ncbi:uncharacterized protein LOC126909935 [Daktulosphaira vitifoliae]|nr:uncharacterized protein LOC126909935 [Daktulosphaira vitifoliae]
MWDIVSIFRHIIFRWIDYNKYYTERIPLKYNSDENEHEENITDSSTKSYDSNFTYLFSEYSSEYNYVRKTVISEFFMDYLFLVFIGWILLEVTVNIDLKKSTFMHAPYRIYSWLIVYYTNIAFMFIFVNDFSWRHLILQTKSSHFSEEIYPTFEGYIYLLVTAIEVFIVQSFYYQQKTAAMSNIIQLKWQYVSKGKVVSKGLDYPSSSTFYDEISNQNFDGSNKKIPYVIDVKQDML